MQQKQSPSQYLFTMHEMSQLFKLKQKEINQYFPANALIKAGNKTYIPGALVKKYLIQRSNDFPAHVIAHINLRGGIGKTTSTISLASRSAQYGLKTCIIDLDPQGSATLAFDIDVAEGDLIFYDIWQNPAQKVMTAVRQIDDHLAIIPSTLDNGLLDISLVNPAAQKNAVKNVCAVLLDNDFDVIVIDCPPSLGAAVISTICATNKLVIPLRGDAFSVKGMQLTFNEINAICETFGIPEPEVKILYSKHDKREKISVDTLDYLQQNYAAYLIPHIINTSSVYTRMLADRKTIFYNSTKSQAKEEFDGYTRYILEIQ